MMAAALTLIEQRATRDLYMFDTYKGMTEPDNRDVDYQNNSAREIYEASSSEGVVDWCNASLTDVKANMSSTGYPEPLTSYVVGDVLETIPDNRIAQIAILRLDTDWYASTLHELKYLFPLLSAGGVLIIDDYGYWKGCRKAVDEYFGSNAPLLSIIDQTGRLAIKLPHGNPNCRELSK